MRFDYRKEEELMPGMNDGVIASAPTMSFDYDRDEAPPPAYGTYEGNQTGIEEEVLPSYSIPANSGNMQPGGTENVVVDIDEWDLGDWLNELDARGVYYRDYYEMFVGNGFDSKGAVAVMSEEDLFHIGIKKLGHRKVLSNAISKLGGAQTLL